jgi:hypothetical protein
MRLEKDINNLVFYTPFFTTIHINRLYSKSPHPNHRLGIKSIPA